MTEIVVARTLDAPPDDVWGVLADYSGVHRWNRFVKQSHATNGLKTGLGAQRYCKMAPAGDLTETITAWEPEALMVLRIDSTSMNPIGEGLVDYVLVPDNDGQSTAMKIRYAFETKWGVIGRLIAPLVGKKLSDAFEDVLTDLEAAAMSAST